MTNKTLFVFGNGFDIAHGMPTKYEHFFYFIEALKIYATEGYDSLQDSEYIQENLNSTISEYLTKVLHPFSKSPIPAYLETIINTLSLNDLENINPWHCYFRDRFKSNNISSKYIIVDKSLVLWYNNIMNKCVLKCVVEIFR